MRAMEAGKRRHDCRRQHTEPHGTLCNHSSDAGVDCIIGKYAELCTCVADNYECTCFAFLRISHYQIFPPKLAHPCLQFTQVTC